MRVPKITPDIIKLMVGFGNYLGSDERKKLFLKDKKLPPVSERLKDVGHWDLANYFDNNKIKAKF